MRTSVAIAAVTMALSAAGPAEAQQWALRADGGRAEIHRPGSASWILAGAVGRDLGQGRSRLELRLSGSPADEGFLTAAAGLEMRLLPGAAVTPIGAVHLGILGEPENVGWMATISAGLRVRVNGIVALRGVATRGLHAGANGPHTLMAGLEVFSRVH